MLPKQASHSQFTFYSTFEEQLSHRHLLYILANQIQWEIFEQAFASLYSRRRPSGQTNTVDAFPVDAQTYSQPQR